MGIMDYMPQWGQNTNQDVSGLPADDTMMQLEMKRRLDMAKALQQQEAPQGQMVSGHYVAPSWTQYAANLFGKYQGAKNEQKAIQDYSTAQQAKVQKLSDALTKIGTGKETTTTDNTPYQIQIPGQSTPTSPWTSEQGASKTINVPMTNTTSTYTPYSTQEKLSMIGQANPDMMGKIAETQIADMFKTKKSTWMDNGSVQVQLDENGNPTGVTLPRGVSPDAAMKQVWEQYKHLNPSAADIMHNQTTLQGQKVTIRGQDLTHKDDAKKLNPLGLPDLSTPQKPFTNSKGWTLHTDAKGNQAYVSPDGKSYEEAK
jgi:hypothetical protein